MQPDKIEELHKSIIHHGAQNERIYLMKINDAERDKLLPALDSLAEENSYSKIFAKIPEKYAGDFLAKGYKREAEIPNFYDGSEKALFLGKYFSEKRAVAENAAELDNVLELALSKQNQGVTKNLKDGFIIRRCIEDDAEEMSKIYKEVFPSYPFPIDDPKYLIETMHSHILYFGVEHEGKLVALSSSEMDEASKNVEMTDFATLPRWLGHSLAAHLLAKMEPAMKKLGIKTAYTIARAVSPGMNITFAKLGYHYGGRLINNTNISGNMESMNVWYKPI